VIIDEASLFQYLWAGVLTVGGGAVSFMTGRAVKRLDHTDEELIKLKDDVAKHKVYSANTYAKDTTTQQSLARVHERIDQSAQESARQITALSGDVKQILLILGGKK